MSGIVALRTVLIADAELLALVPATRIAAGIMPLNTAAPFIQITSISVIDMATLTPGLTRFVTERVQASVVAKSDDSMRAVFAAMKNAGADQLYPTVAGISGVTIHTGGAGPDIVNEEAKLYQKNMDFFIRYTETR